MSSSDRTGTPGKAVAAEPSIAPTPAAGDDGQGDQDEGAPADPWFTPGPKRTVAAPGADESPDWFLRTGRAGLFPDSMTEPAQGETPPRPDRPGHGEAAGSPPWEGEPKEAATGVPPPWENGPWPGHGDLLPASRGGPRAASSDPAAIATAAGASPRRPSMQLALAAGAGVVVVIVIIVVIVTAMSGSPGGGCGTYPTAVRQAYVRAMTDLRNRAPVSVQSTALAQAASVANASAAATGQLRVRTAMFAMASDLDQAHADVAANRTLSATLRQRLSADGTALPASCPG